MALLAPAMAVPSAVFDTLIWLALVVSFPLVRAKVPATVVVPLRVTPALLLLVKLLTVAGSPLPVTCADTPLQA